MSLINFSQKNKGAAMLTFVLFFTFATSSMIFILSQSIFTDLGDFNRLADSKRAFLVSESLTEDVVYRITFGIYEIDEEEALVLDGISAFSTTTYDSPNDIYSIDTTALKRSSIRKSQAIMSIGAGSAFNYGMQAGNGGVKLTGNADIVGNIYSNGSVVGSTNADVYGDVISAGPTGLVKDIHATGSVWANTIDNIEIDGDAYFNIELNMSPGDIGGASTTPSPNQPTTTMPLSTTTIQEWKDVIEDYGTTIPASDPDCLDNGTFEINGIVTYGYHKIECNVNISGNTSIITLDGPLWIEGNLTFSNGPELRIDPDVGRRSVQLLVSSSTNKDTSSKIFLQGSTDFFGSGDDRSYIMLLSENESASLGGSQVAIDINNSANGDVLMYAEYGLVDVANNIDLREVTAYQINVANGSSITYEEGLASVLFTSGPGGAYILSDWQQTD